MSTKSGSGRSANELVPEKKRDDSLPEMLEMANEPIRKRTMWEEKLKQPNETPKLGFFVYYLAFMAVIGGFLFGYDTGIVSSAMLYIPLYPNMQPMDSLWKELIVSLTPGAAAIASLFAGPAADIFGRKKVIIAASCVFTVGAIVCAASTSKAVLLVGRILLGVAIGFASMVVPVYVSESSPYYLRGAMITAFQLMVTFGLFCANIFAGAFSYWNPVYVGWRLMLGCAMIPSVIQFIGFFFLPESPRYLYSAGKIEEAGKTLERIYAHNQEWINYVTSQIRDDCETEKKAKEFVGNQLVIVRIFKTPHVLKALCIGCAIQAFQQLSGINTIMYYTATIINSAGIQDPHQSIWIASGIAAVNFISTFIPLTTVEKFGRRILMMISIAGVTGSLIMMGVSFLLIHGDSSLVLKYNATQEELNKFGSHVTKCDSFNDCDSCVTEPFCGFCQNGTVKAPGYCYPKDPDSTETSLVGFCSTTDTQWAFQGDFCMTKFTVMPIVFMIVYLVFFAVGFAPLCWVLNGEFYPLWARGNGCALSTFFNWAFNLIVSLTYLTLSESITRYGAFFLYAGFTVIAFIFVYIFVPETKGMSIESVEKLFMSNKELEEIERQAKSRGVDNKASNINDNE